MGSEKDYKTKDGLLTESKGAEKLNKFFDFESISDVQNRDIILLSNENLRNAIAAARTWKERSLIQEIRDCFSKSSKLIFVIRGMRRTGKTTALLQFCENPDKTMFISIRRGSNGSIHQLITLLLSMDICYDDCLIIDEITELSDALTGLHFLYDVVPCKKIIVTGSDSLVLNNPFIEKNNLMRVCASHNLNYISLEEWCTLTGSKDYKEYIRSLGTLMRVFDGELVQWFNLSLLDNIMNSFNRNSIIMKKYPLEFPLLAVASVLLQACFGTEIYTKSFKQEYSEMFIELFDLEGLDSFLSLRNTNKNKFLSELYWATKMLEELDYVVEIPFYDSLSDLKDNRVREQKCICTIPYVSLMMKSILARVGNTKINHVLNDYAIGAEFENFVVAQIVSINKKNDYRYKCGKVRAFDGTVEFDLVLEDIAENVYVIEVKYSTKSTVQLSNLESKEKFSKVCGDNAKKICIYRGESFLRTSQNGFIDMVNVIDFFCEYFPKMLKQDPYCPEEIEFK